MKTRFATIMIALIALATGAKAATGYGVKIAGVEITSDNYNNLASIPGVTVNSGGRIYYDSSSKTLYLKNVDIKTNNIGIENKERRNLSIVFEGYSGYEYNNGATWIQSYKNKALLLRRQTEIKCEGNGYAVIESSTSDDLSCELSEYYVDEEAITFRNADITLQGQKTGINGHGGRIHINNSHVEIFGGDEDPAIKDLQSLSIFGGSHVTLYGNDNTKTVSNLTGLYLEDMVISSPSGATYTNNSFYKNGQIITGDIEFTTTAIKVDATNFPDANFLSYVKSIVDTDHSGYLTKNEIDARVEVFAGSRGISNFKGIEHFTSLKSFYCEENTCTTLDLSKNTALETLRCYSNNLNSLNLTKNTKLTSLNFYDNNITSLDLSKNTDLKTLTCYNNKLTSLNLTNNTNLKTLECYGNNLTSITLGNHPNLTEVRLASSTSDKTINFDINAYVVNKLPTVSSGVEATFKPGYCITKADVTKARNKGWTVNTEGREAYKLSDIIPNTNFRSYVSSLSCCLSGWLVQQLANNITEMNVSSKNISDLTGISYFPNLITLNCQNNTLTSLNVSSLTNLQYLYCSGNRLTSLNLSSNKQLEKVECQNNQLTSITLPSSSTSLSEVRCYGNKLKDSYMTNTVSSLPYRNTQGSLYVATAASTEGNALNAQQRATLKSKKWSAYYLNSNNTWVPYEEGIVTSVEGVENEQQANDGTPQYNLQGQRVGNGYHGIVVRNGRKVLVK